MSARLPLIPQIQADAADDSKSVVQVVRMAKIAASKLSLTDTIEWIDHELDGYPHAHPDKLPAYRVVRGECQCWDPYNGWLPVIISNSDLHNAICRRGVAQPLATIEDMVKSGQNPSPVMAFPPEQQELLRRLTGENTKFQLSLSRVHVSGILNGVRSLALEWALQLEAAGILGENMSFKQEEMTMAKSAAQNFFIQNAGVIGNVADQASLTFSQSARIDVSRAKDLIDEISPLLNKFPEDVRSDLSPLIDQAKQCVNEQPPNQGRLRSILTSVKRICENAGGSILANGISASISSLL